MPEDERPEPSPAAQRWRRRAGFRFESWIDRQVREAMERGEFDNLPGAGKPIPNLNRRDADWWIHDKLEREGLRPPLPEALALRREAAEIQRALADVTTEAAAREIIEDLNERIKESWLRRGEGGPFLVVNRLNVADTLEQWRRRRGGGSEPGST